MAVTTWWLCRRRRGHTKLGPDKSLAFRPPHRKPTAVKSPGSTSHYLKKSPSPTGPAKSPPGSGGLTPSPTGSQPSQPGNQSLQPRSPQGTGTPAQTPPGEITLTIENERDKAELENNEKTDNGNANKDSNKDGLGQLEFKLRYRSEQNALAVTVVKCKDLPARGTNATSDPYVKLQLLPDKQHRVKTRVLRNTKDPVYDEDFTFYGISQSQLQVRLGESPACLISDVDLYFISVLQKMTLHFVVLSFDRYSRDDMIGEVVCALSSVPGLDQVDNQQLALCREICPRSLKVRH